MISPERQSPNPENHTQSQVSRSLSLSGNFSKNPLQIKSFLDSTPESGAEASENSKLISDLTAWRNKEHLRSQIRNNPHLNQANAKDTYNSMIEKKYDLFPSRIEDFPSNAELVEPLCYSESRVGLSRRKSRLKSFSESEVLKQRIGKIIEGLVRRDNELETYKKVCENIFCRINEELKSLKKDFEIISKALIMTESDAKVFAKISTEILARKQEKLSAPGRLSNDFKNFNETRNKLLEKNQQLVISLKRQNIQIILKEEEEKFQNIEKLLAGFADKKKSLDKKEKETHVIGSKFVDLALRALDGKKNKSDFYITELHFIKQQKERSLAQKELGDYIITLIDVFKDFEASHSAKMKERMNSYKEEMNSLYGLGDNLNKSRQIDHTQLEGCETYPEDQLISLELLGFLRGKGQTIVSYLEDIEFEIAPCLKLYESENVFLGKVGKETFKGPYNAVLTADGYLVIYKGLKTEDVKIYNRIPLVEIDLRDVPKEPGWVQIVQKRRFLRNKKFCLNFNYNAGTDFMKVLRDFIIGKRRKAG